MKERAAVRAEGRGAALWRPAAGRAGQRRSAVLAVTSAALVLLTAVAALADARTDYLVRALRTSSMFRVRAQAAISLGRVEAEPQVIRALGSALNDDHPSVRAAAAASLERLGDPSALPALRRATRDREAAVRNAATRAVERLERVASSQTQRARIPQRGRSEPSEAPGGEARFYVAVGRPGSNVRGLSGETLDAARELIERTAGGISGVEIAPPNERPRAASRVIRRRDLVGYYLDASIVEIEERPNGGLRARVSVVLQTYPERNIRSMLQGAATVMGASGDSARRQAIEGALRGALRNLPQAMEAGAARASASSRGRR